MKGFSEGSANLREAVRGVNETPIGYPLPADNVFASEEFRTGERFGNLHLLNQGWYMTYPLGLLSVLVFAIAFERLWRYRGVELATRDMTRKLVDHLLRRDLPAARALCEASTTPMSNVFAEGLRWRNIALEDLQQVLGTARQEC